MILEFYNILAFFAMSAGKSLDLKKQPGYAASGKHCSG